MKRAIVLIVLLVSVLGFMGFHAASDNAGYMKVYKSLQIFGELFRQVANEYVDEVDPVEFVDAGIEGMLKHLDPYTVYIEDEDSDEVDIITTGIYGGLGITTSIIDSMVTVVGMNEGSPAEKAGVRIGDKIYKIDSTIVLSISGDELRRHTRGKPGTKAFVSVLRNGVKDTLRFTLIRQEITLKNVTYSGIIGNDIGYIRLERFTYGAAQEVREALTALRTDKALQNRTLQGVILDVRDNPGGLLDAAVGISELFLPAGSTIVSTRGRSPDSERRYFSRRNPIEPDIPLAVLINENTASASEIVAGAMQDSDRGILLGERSFGKGLVQTISSLPFNATLKMTTAKYYTPSGRCIQKIDYNQRRHGIVKSTTDTTKIFKTQNGRLVREANGIAPDTVVSLKAASDFMGELFRRNAIFHFANEYAGSRKTLAENFTVDKPVFDQFLNYVRRTHAHYESVAFRKMNELEMLLKSRKNNSQVVVKLDGIKEQLAKEQVQELERQRPLIADVLHEEILERFYPRSKVIGLTLERDAQIKSAIALLHDVPRYKTLLNYSAEKKNDAQKNDAQKINEQK